MIKTLKKNINILILSLMLVLNTIFSFLLALRRYNNYEYGKFDLGNMSQMVWNTSQGRFMEVTDQFGTNMIRWGMSHVDPILVLFAPIYWVFPHPMVLVLAQHILILSAIFPLFFLVQQKIRSSIAAYAVVLSYILYPAIGYTLVWTGFHGISFVAPLIIWAVWYLEKNNFLVGANKYKYVVYWLLFFLMLIGKEEIGAILALGGVFLYFKNKSLGIKTFVIGMAWTLFCFLVLIPGYSDVRQESVINFVDSVSIDQESAQFLTGENFFLHRYAHLGSSYSEIIINGFTRPEIFIDTVFSSANLNAINHLVGPLGYIVVLNPIWLISLPDLAILMLSMDSIFDISNHRIAFVISGLFLSYLYILAFLKNRYEWSSKLIPLVTIVVLGLNLYFSGLTANPIYITAKSIIENRVITKVFADEIEIGYERRVNLPMRNMECSSKTLDLINEFNPDIYTGPDYLGAHTSLRMVNALFPSRFWDAEIIVVDLFDTKSISPFGRSGEWIRNKAALREMLQQRNLRHLYSCGKLSVFVEGESTDIAYFADNKPDGLNFTLSTPRLDMEIVLIDLPSDLDKSAPEPIEIAMSYSNSFSDKVTFWKFESSENKDQTFAFINYLGIGSPEGIDRARQNMFSIESYTPILDDLPAGIYKVFFGAGDLIRASEIYLGEVNVY